MARPWLRTACLALPTVVLALLIVAPGAHSQQVEPAPRMPKFDIGATHVQHETWIAAGQTFRIRRRDRIATVVQPPQNLEGLRVALQVLSGWNPNAGPGRTVRGRNATLDVTIDCRSFEGGLFSRDTLAEGQARFDRNGNVVFQENVDIDVPCTELLFDADFGGNMRMMGPGDVIDRVGFQPIHPDSACTPGPETLCLDQGRFQVEVDWSQGNRSGMATAVPHTDNQGYFWFFDPDNSEMLVRVLDACPTTNRFWVFAGALTNVQVDLTVMDTETGQTRTYANPLGTPFQPIQDTNAFATCP